MTCDTLGYHGNAYNIYDINATSLLQNKTSVFDISMVQWLTRIYGVASINTLRPRENGRHFADDILKCIFLNEKVWIFFLNFTEVCSLGSN